MTVSLLSETRCFAGAQRFYSHESRECRTEMRFSMYLPAQASERALPVLFYLAGLTCTEETFMIKAGAQRVAAELGLILVAPDTSPRKVRLPGDDANWDFGLGAGFYVDATQVPWSQHYRMYSYITSELPALLPQFLVEQLKPELFEAACRSSGTPLRLRRHDGYDHSYYFISTFIADHLQHHARLLS